MLFKKPPLFVLLFIIFSFYQCQTDNDLFEENTLNFIDANKSLVNANKSINTRLWPVETCTEIDGVPEISRPKLTIHRSIGVWDQNNDGVLDGADIQKALESARDRHLDTFQETGIKEYFTVQLLDDSVDTYYIDKPLRIYTGTILEGNGKTITPNTNYTYDKIIIFHKNSNNVGIHNTRVVANYKVPNSGIYIEDNVENVFIYDNHLQDETADGSGRQQKIGGGEGLSAMIIISDNASEIFIDGNFFLHVAGGIINNGANVKNLNITHNTFSKWRQRAILIKGKDDGMVENIRIINNRINPPKLGEVRQPILVSGVEDKSKFNKNITINFNSIYSADEPHVWEWVDGIVDGRRDSKMTFGTGDVISIQQTEGFEIIGNCIFNAGEVGIAVATSSHNGLVALNYIENADTSGIAIGSSLKDLTQQVYDISVLSNTIVNPSRCRYEIDKIFGTGKYPETNRNNSFGAWAKSGIGYTNSRNIYDNNNTIIENETVLNPDYNPALDTNIRRNINVPSLTLSVAYYSARNINSSHGNLGILNVLDHVIDRDCYEEENCN